MTRTISLIIGITATVLSVGVAPALGEGRLAGSLEPVQVAPDWFERAAIKSQTDATVVNSPDWFERAALQAESGAVVVSRPDSHDLVATVDNGYLDAADRAQRIDVVVPTAFSDAHERSTPPSGQITSSTNVSSGSELELPQIGIGFAIGLLLGMGLFLTMRSTRGRQLAH
jgi:hypothetical protein